MSVKYTIKLSTEESQAFENFRKMVKPPEINNDDFHKLVFLRGIEYINMAIREEFERLKVEDPAKFAELTTPPPELTPEPDAAQ